MSLKEYREKRDFSITSEPKPVEAKSTGKPIFVIQEHHATRLHYDFRLEVDGVLKSWAVTKKPSLDPSVRRLAVEVEDHPVAYAKFSGDIPEGEYGAGHVEIWDHGTYRNLLREKSEAQSMQEALTAGHLEVELLGKRLHGAFALIRMKGDERRPQWLLVKMKDKIVEKEKKEHRKGRTKKNGARHDQMPSKATPEQTGWPPKEIEFTSIDKMMFPEVEATKGDVLDYYGRIANRLLPHLKDRPMTLERLPDGLVGAHPPHFWQKHTPDYYPDWIPRVTLPSERGKPVEYVLVNDRQTLLYLVNQGTITFHPWMSRIGNLDRPDYVLFDLDPGERTFSDAVTVAKHLHEIFRERKIDSYVKTSGKSGLHVLVPWTREGDDDAARAWALEIAEAAAEDISEIATTERSKRKREGRLYIDVMQNVRGHHAVPPYVLRATPQATVSTPLRWSDLTAALTPTKFTIRTISRRLGQMKNDPMERLVERFSGT